MDNNSANLTTGVIYVAFGSEYDNQCAHSVKVLRNWSDIPVLVVSNLKERSQVWKESGEVSFHYIKSEDPENDKSNRIIKMSLDKYSPFDISLFCDTDTAVQSAEFLEGFLEAAKYDVMFSVRPPIATRFGQLPDYNYKKAFNLFRMSYPATVYKEGVFFFRKTPLTRALFWNWLDCWKKLNAGRDMPALFAACQKAKGVNIGELPYGWDSRDGHIVIHGHGDFQVPGLPRITKFKPTIDEAATWRKMPPAPIIKKELK